MPIRSSVAWVAGLAGVAALAASPATLRLGGATFPSPAAFEPTAARESARQHAAMVRIAGGRQPIGAPTGDSRSAGDAPLHWVTVAPFRIDRTEVTNAQFAEFLNALPLRPIGSAAAGRAGASNFASPDRALFLEAHRPRAYPIIGLDDDEARIAVDGGRFAPARDFESHPVTEVSWAGAMLYCAWRGARLPSEVEWEAAARGTDGRPFPWGDAAPGAEHATLSRAAGDTLPVGSKPRGATPEGLLDMAGSLAEWTSTLYRPYPYRADDGREEREAPGERVTRGGDYAYQSAPEHLVGWHRRGFSRAPASGHRHIGFRCAVSV